MMRIINKVEVPPGGWTYYVPQTGTQLDGQSYQALVVNVTEHLLANRLPVMPDIEDRIEHQICRRLPPERCKIRLPKGTDLGTRLNLGQIMAGTMTVLHWLATGAAKVTQEEADARAAICVRCQANVNSTGCASCTGNSVRGLIAKTLGAKQTAYDDKLYFCMSCGCSLKASVWCPLDIQQQHMPESINRQLPDLCWKKKPERNNP